MKKEVLKHTSPTFGAQHRPFGLALLGATLSCTLMAQTPPQSDAPVSSPMPMISAMESMHARQAVGPMGGPPSAAEFQKMHERRVQWFEKNLADLKKQLSLSAAQEPQWESFIQSVRPQSPPAPMLERAQMKEWAQLAAPLRAQKMLDFHMARHDEKLAQMRAHLEALKEFYAQLSPQQQKTFDQVSWKHHTQLGRFARAMHQPG